MLRRLRPDGIVYFTDGQGPLPGAAPGVPVLWVLTRPEEFACPFGALAVLQRKVEAPRPAPRRR